MTTALRFPLQTGHAIPQKTADAEKAYCNFVEKCLRPIDLEKFLFYGELAIAAAQAEPSRAFRICDLSFRIADREGDPIPYKIPEVAPLHRMSLALIEYMSDEDQSEILPAMLLRLSSLLNFLLEGKLDRWGIRGEISQQVYLPEAVFRAAAQAPIDKNLELEWGFFHLMADETLGRN